VSPPNPGQPDGEQHSGEHGADHPSVEQVAEHLEGLLEDAAARRVGEHLRHCARCADVARDLDALPDALRAAAVETTPMPEHVSDRVRAAIAAEAARDRAGSPPSTPSAPSAPSAPSGVTTLPDRRRRRRLAAGGLLAAAAATVVAVGLGQMLQGGGPGQAGQASPAESPAGVTALEEDARADAPRAARPTAGPRAAAGRLDAGLGRSPERRAFAALVRGAAAAYSPAAPRQDRQRCADAALGRAAAGPGAAYSAYAVRLPAPLRGVPGVVVLRPSAAPTRGVLVACAPQPRVLLRVALPG
jgi:hypothetical protein